MFSTLPPNHHPCLVEVSVFSDRKLKTLNHVGHCHWILVAQVIDLTRRWRRRGYSFQHVIPHQPAVLESTKQLLEFRRENTSLRPGFFWKSLVVSNFPGRNTYRQLPCLKSPPRWWLDVSSVCSFYLHIQFLLPNELRSLYHLFLQFWLLATSFPMSVEYPHLINMASQAIHHFPMILLLQTIKFGFPNQPG